MKFVRKYGLTYPSVRDVDGKLAQDYGTRALPETFVIDRQGRVAAISRGQVDERFLDRALDGVGGVMRRAALVAARRAGARSRPAGAALAATPRTTLPDVEDEVMCVVCGVAAQRRRVARRPTASARSSAASSRRARPRSRSRRRSSPSTATPSSPSPKAKGFDVTG